MLVVNGTTGSTGLGCMLSMCVAPPVWSFMGTGISLRRKDELCPNVNAALLSELCARWSNGRLVGVVGKASPVALDGSDGKAGSGMAGGGLRDALRELRIITLLSDQHWTEATIMRIRTSATRSRGCRSACGF